MLMNMANPRCFATLLLLFGSFEFALAEGPQQLVVSRPFVQVKATDAAGKVSYRVGGVFTEAADPAKRVTPHVRLPGRQAILIHCPPTHAAWSVDRPLRSPSMSTINPFRSSMRRARLVRSSVPILSRTQVKPRPSPD